MIITLKKSPNRQKKYRVIFDNATTVDFGASGYEDYTIHKNKIRMKSYLKRHKPREKWGKTGIKTAGFWSRWLLWHKPSLNEAKRNIEKRFGVKIILK